jgi:cytochrome c biogenesis protein
MTKSVKERKTFSIWSIFSSVRLTVLLLMVLAVASVIGTLIPQQEGAFDIYHTLWFRIIIGLLALNLIICSINRLPGALKVFRTVSRPDRSKPFEDLPPQRQFSVRGTFEDLRDPVAEFMKGSYKRVQTKDTVNESYYYGEKGRYSVFGAYLVHLSIIVILIGGIVGSLLGFEAFVNILEGDTVDTVALRKDRAPKPLGFGVRCEKFTVDFYDNGTPREYRSELSFLSDGKVAKEGSLLVNHPMTFRGITFYQSSYGTIPGGRVRLKVSRGGDHPENTTQEVEFRKPVPLPGDGGQFLVADIREDFMRMGPAVLILIRHPEGHETRFWVFQHQEKISEQFPGIFQKYPKLNPSTYRPYTFFLDHIHSRFYTGLQVNRDPGVPLVWLGCFMLVLGFFVTFFTSHRRFWVRVSRDKERIRVSVAGRANRNPVGLDRELDRLTLKLRNHLGS